MRHLTPGLALPCAFGFAVVTTVAACASAAGDDPVAVTATGDVGTSVRAPESVRADAGTGADDAPAWLPLGPDETYADRSLEAWSRDWARWVFAQTSCDNPALDPDGSLCALYQDEASPVFLLSGGQPGTVRTRCVVPEGKAILVPLSSFIADNGGNAPDEQYTPAELQAAVTDAQASTRDLLLRADGAAMSDLEKWAVPMTKFSYEVPPEPNFYGCTSRPGVEGTIDPAYFAGFFVLFPPPPVGRHTLTYGGTLSSFGGDAVNYANTTFTVE